MFNPLCLLLITILCSQYVASRHLQEPYSPYSDYSYSNCDALPYQSHHFHQHPPPGTYFDQRQRVFRPFPGGGVPVLVDYDKRCSNEYTGLKAHREQHKYIVCKPECVIIGKCQNLQIFNSTLGQCVQHSPPEYIPTCTKMGRFPLFSDCRLYYKCEEDLKRKIYSCPESKIFSPASKKCIDGNKCTTTEISPYSSYLPEYCASKFPPCFETGIFRSPSDCSLYYKCDLKNNGIYIQTRLRCPQGNFYDLENNKCLPSSKVPCDYIQFAELVYPKLNQPPVYPSEFDLESLVENHYPTEHTKEEINNKNLNLNESKNNEDDKRAVTTTQAPTTLKINLDEEDDVQSDVLSDFLKIGSRTKPVSTQSAEISTEGSGLEVESEVSTTLQPDDETTEQTKSEDTSTLPNVTETEEVSETNAANDATEDPQKSFTENETTNSPEEEETTSARIFDQSAEIIENNENKDRFITEDTHTKDTSQTQNKISLPKLTTTSINTDSEPTKIIIASDSSQESRSTLHEQNSTTPVSNPITTQQPTTQLTTTSDNLEKNQLPNETIVVPEKDNILTTGRNLETAETSQLSENTATTQATVLDIGKPQDVVNVIPITLSKSEITTTKSDTTAAALNPPSDKTTTTFSGLNTEDSENKIDDFEKGSSGLEKETLTLTTKQTESTSQEQISSNEKTVTLRQDDFRDEEFRPVHSNSLLVTNKLADQTTDPNFISENFEKGFSGISTTILTTTDPTITTESIQQQEQKADTVWETKNDDVLTTNVRSSQTFTDKTESSATITELPNTKTTSSITAKAVEDLADEKSQEDLLDVMDSEIVNHGRSEESNDVTVTAPPLIEPNDGGIPRLEIIAEQPIDVHFSICPSICDKDHKHNNGTRAVLLKWFANKSNQTLAFETANDLTTDDSAVI